MGTYLEDVCEDHCVPDAIVLMNEAVSLYLAVALKNEIIERAFQRIETDPAPPSAVVEVPLP